MRSRHLISLTIIILAALAIAAGCSRSVADVDPALFPDPMDNTITFWGHACAYIDVNGFGIVTDPVFEKGMIVRRRKIPVPPPASYAGTGIILISHPHNDHLSPNTLKTFPAAAVILCPEQSVKYLEDLAQETFPMKPGDRYVYPGGEIVAVAAHHMGGRYSVRGADDGRALGYVVYTPQSVIYYTGDTNYFDGFEQVGVKHRPDVTMINISGHLHGTDAALAALATVAPTVIPMHFGAYGYLFFGEQKQPRDYDEIETVLEPVLQLLKPGESMPLSGKRNTVRENHAP
jgi:L-ascorbate metabolism protein UlaG (beta-lactamase superfamily)